MATKHGLIRAIYLYLFTIVGLALLVIGTVRFIDMGLKMFVFTKADDPERIQQKYYYSTPIPMAGLEKYQQSASTDLTDEEKTTLKSFLENYKKWEEEEGKIDYLASKRQKDASNSLAMILVGLPLYLYHWRIIRKETKEPSLAENGASEGN